MTADTNNNDDSTNDSQLATQSRLNDKPSWANWIEYEAAPHLVIGIECRDCKVSVMRSTPRKTTNSLGLWNTIDHEDTCRHAHSIEEEL